MRVPLVLHNTWASGENVAIAAGTQASHSTHSYSFTNKGLCLFLVKASKGQDGVGGGGGGGGGHSSNFYIA